MPRLSHAALTLLGAAGMALCRATAFMGWFVYFRAVALVRVAVLLMWRNTTLYSPFILLSVDAVDMTLAAF